MRRAVNERYRLALMGWLATVATSLAFLPALSQKRFFLIGAAVAALVVAVGLVLRAIHTPPLVVSIGQLITLCESLLVGFGDHLRLGLIPTPATFAGIRELVSSGIHVAQQYAAPAPPNAGLLLMVVFYIGLVAFLVDVVGVGLHRVTLSGLPLLALYTVPVAVLPQGVPMLFFLPGAAAFIAMVMADERERLAHWGRLVARGSAGLSDQNIDTGALSATGRRIAFTALAVSVLGPFLIPTITGSLFGLGGNGLGGGGTQYSFADPMVSLANQLRRTRKVDLLDVRAQVPPEYLRLTVLDTLDPQGWRASPVDFSQTISTEQRLPRPVGLTSQVPSVEHSMSVSPTRNYPRDGLWLPVPFDVSYVALNNFAFVPSDDTVTATDGNALAGLALYNLIYSDIAPTAAQLADAGPAPADIVTRYTALPSGLPPIVNRLATSITRGAPTAYGKALALQSFFRGGNGFSYDVHAAYGDGYRALARFLRDRRGFCQQYSATMAVMARALGIPARVVVGFLHADHRGPDGSFVFTSKDAHSWDELYFAGVGWVRFDPTPGVGAPRTAYAPITHQKSKGGQVPGSGHLPTVTPTSAAPAQPHQTQHRAADATVSSPQAPPSLWWLLLPLGLAVVFTPAVTRVAIRRRRLNRPLGHPTPGEAAEAAWAELRDHMRDLHLPWAANVTPRRRAAALAGVIRRDKEAVAALDRLALDVERARYARTVDIEGSPARDVTVVMAALGGTTDRWTRTRARLLPASLLRTARGRLRPSRLRAVTS